MKKVKNKFFHFSQNNSGGSFYYSENLANHVIIEATNADEANNILETLGGYFDGCAEGLDCSCCGDRWYRLNGVWDKGNDEPSLYDAPIKDYTPFLVEKNKPFLILHRKDKKPEKFFPSRGNNV